MSHTNRPPAPATVDQLRRDCDAALEDVRRARARLAEAEAAVARSKARYQAAAEALSRALCGE